MTDPNVMRTYTTIAEEPKHHIQYDQGEDRWLCTLMLKQVENCMKIEKVKVKIRVGEWNMLLPVTLILLVLKDLMSSTSKEEDGCLQQCLM